MRRVSVAAAWSAATNAAAFASATPHVVVQVNTHVPREDLSRWSVEAFLQDALFAALAMPSPSAEGFEDRLRTALDGLLRLLGAPSQKFTCWIPVGGLALDVPSARFGDVRFATFSQRQLRSMARRAPPSTQRHTAWKFSMTSLRKHGAWKRPCAVVEIEARDFSSAEALARRRTRQILDVLNLFTNVVPYTNGWFYLRGETTRAQEVVPTQRHDGTLMANHVTLPPLADVSWKGIRGARHVAGPLRALSQLATKRKYGAELWFSSAQWVGRAAVDRRREQSFLLYAIALETMVSPTKEGQGVGQRIRLRVAHILGKTVNARERIAKEVNKLYGTRSKIVHHGSYEVTDDELGRMRVIVTSTLFRLLRNRRLHAMTRDELADWFDRKLLR
jgi:hypothetical protein